MFRRSLVAAALLIGTAASAHAQVKASQPAVPQAQLDAIRAATQKYQDVKAAEKDGYINPGLMCIVAAHEGQPRQLGAMGVHYVRPELLKITGTQPRVNGEGTHTDFMQPAILVYEPQADGSLRLGAIENLVWAKAWHDAGNKEPPSFNGFDYYYIHDNPDTPVDEAHGFEPHYELHFWLYRDNPIGMFANFNPSVSCEHAKP